MMDELKQRIAERIGALYEAGGKFDELHMPMLAEFTWGIYSGLEWVLDTIAELEIKDD